MNEKLELVLLGNIEVQRDGVLITGFRSAKTQALLAYLAVTGLPHLRRTLASLLWSELPQVVELKNLTKVASNLRRLVGSHLEVTRQSVAFNRDTLLAGRGDL